MEKYLLKGVAMNDTISISESIKVISTYSMTIAYIQTAAHLCRQTSEIESTGEKDNRIEQLSYAASSIINTVAFLEANINEFFAVVSDLSRKYYDCIDESTRKMISDLRTMGIPKTASYSILDKYQIALTFLKLDRFDQGTDPFQSVKLLIQLRNQLIHYEIDEEVIYDSKESIPLTTWFKRFDGKFFPNNLSLPTCNFLPTQLVGHGCCKWGIEKALELTDTFYNRIGVKPIYDHVRKNLTTSATSIEE